MLCFWEAMYLTIEQKIPIIGGQFRKEVPASDNVRFWLSLTSKRPFLSYLDCMRLQSAHYTYAAAVFCARVSRNCAFELDEYLGIPKCSSCRYCNVVPTLTLSIAFLDDETLTERDAYEWDKGKLGYPTKPSRLYKREHEIDQLLFHFSSTNS